MKNIIHFNTSPIYESFNSIIKEQKEIGHYGLPEQNIKHILEYSKNKEYKTITVVGIGGSNLGISMIYNFLKDYSKNLKKLFFLESTDPVKLNSRLDRIDMEKNLFIIISKLGTTLETIAILKYVISKVEFKKDKFLIITDKNSKLDKFAKEYGIDVFNTKNNIGGRFSVLSIAGLLPLALCNIDISLILKGAKKVKDEFFLKKDIYEDLILKASYYAKNKDGYNINVIFSYSEYLREFNAWYTQLWGESLGKKDINNSCVSMTPVGLIGPVDQHSFLQLIVDGKRNKTVTFIKIKNLEDKTMVPNISLKHLESMDIINGIDFSKLINLQADSIIKQLLNQQDIPVDIIELEQKNEESIGELIYYYELLTSLTASLLDIDAYDQPGVEEGKVLLKQKLEAILNES